MTREEVSQLEVEWARSKRAVDRLDRAHNWSMSQWRQRSAKAETRYFEASRQLKAELDAKGR